MMGLHAERVKNQQNTVVVVAAALSLARLANDPSAVVDYLGKI